MFPLKAILPPRHWKIRGLQGAGLPVQMPQVSGSREAPTLACGCLRVADSGWPTCCRPHWPSGLPKANLRELARSAHSRVWLFKGTDSRWPTCYRFHWQSGLPMANLRELATLGTGRSRLGARPSGPSGPRSRPSNVWGRGNVGYRSVTPRASTFGPFGPSVSPLEGLGTGQLLVPVGAGHFDGLRLLKPLPSPSQHRTYSCSPPGSH